MKTSLKLLAPALLAVAGLNMFAGNALAAFNNFQGFEVNTGDWNASQGITRVPGGGGSLHLTAASGSYYAELQNQADGSGYTGYGDGGFSHFGGSDPVYHGDFYQAIDVYVNATWSPAAA